MNTRGNTIGTTVPRPTRHTRALPQPQPVIGSAATTHRCARAAQIPHRPPVSEETIRQPQDHLVSPEAPSRGVKPAAREAAVSRDDHRQAKLCPRGPPRTT